jgi:hypothetical protein
MMSFRRLLLLLLAMVLSLAAPLRVDEDFCPLECPTW